MQTRTLRLTVFWITLAMFVVSFALAAGADTKKGKTGFRTNCRVCHDGKTAGAPAFTPMSRTITQWQKVFAPGGAAHACVPRVKQKTGVALTEQDLKDIGAYAVQHAADSDQPATCGS